MVVSMTNQKTYILEEDANNKHNYKVANGYQHKYPNWPLTS